MDLTELSDHELRVFMGLLKLVVHADQEVTNQEREVIADLWDRLGTARWNTAVQDAQRCYETVEQLEEDARKVTRRDAQILIHDVLWELAHADELIDAEAHVLRWVVQEWQPPRDPPALDSFELMDD